MDGVVFFTALSHTAWGLVPMAAAVALGVALRAFHRRWQGVRAPGVLLVWLALWGLQLVAVALVLAAVFHVGCASLMAREVACRANMKQLGEAMQRYLADHDETFPPADRWEVALKPYLTTQLTCPAVKDGTGHYGMNRALSGRKLYDIDEKSTVLFFETRTTALSFSGGKADVAARRHGGGAIFTFASGEAKRVYESNQKVLIWTETPALPKKEQARE